MPVQRAGDEDSIKQLEKHLATSTKLCKEHLKWFKHSLGKKADRVEDKYIVRLAAGYGNIVGHWVRH